jgi:hypothetical protein
MSTPPSPINPISGSKKLREKLSTIVLDTTRLNEIVEATQFILERDPREGAFVCTAGMPVPAPLYALTFERTWQSPPLIIYYLVYTDRVLLMDVRETEDTP